MAKIFLSIPILGKPEMNMVYTTYAAILSTKHQVRLYINENDSLISRVRNVHISTFLHDYPEYDYFMSIDSDLEILNTYQTNNIFTKLIEHDLDFTGGLYSVKKPGAAKCSSIMMDLKGTLPFDSGLKEVRWLSSGCWCVKRHVVEKMAAAYPELAYDGDDNMAGKKINGLYIPMLYTMQPEDFGIEKPFVKYLSEDWSFCERWRAIGGKIFADTSIALNHIGKFSYQMWPVQPPDAEQVRKAELQQQAVMQQRAELQQQANTPPAPGYEL